MALSLPSTFTLVITILLSYFFTSLVLCNAYPVRFLKNHNLVSKRHARFHRRHFASQNYRDALTKSIIFFEGQRSGYLPRNQRITWRRNSGLKDGSDAGVNLVGGYYDAGDNVKFGFPMAFTTTMLAWSVIEFGGAMKTELQNARTAVRWGTDYLLKATAKRDTIYVQVGDPYKDHACWERPEDMDTPRTVYKVDKNSPGSDVAAETAAALAAASLVFRRSDPGYSKVLLRRAMRVFRFANKYRGAYSDGLSSVVCPFYCSFSGYQDELLWGAAWLYRASNNRRYLRYIKSQGQNLGAEQGDNSFGWDNKHAGTRVLLSKVFVFEKVQFLSEYKDHVDDFICSLVPGSPSFSAQYTPGGLLYKMSDTNMQYVTSTSFLLATYLKYLKVSRSVVKCGGLTVTPGRIRKIAKRQVDYILGDNPLKMSYMVGYGKRYPRRIHHRGSSLPSIAVHPSKLQCNSGFNIYSQTPNPNVLIGAVVGGPDQNDQYGDQRVDFEQSEPATYINAPLVGVLAYFARSFGQL